MLTPMLYLLHESCIKTLTSILPLNQLTMPTTAIIAVRPHHRSSYVDREGSPKLTIAIQVASLSVAPS